MSKYIPYGRQSITDSDIQSVVKVLKCDFITQGPQVRKFEKALCISTQAKYAVAVSNGTAALHLACLAAGIGKGDEVITSPLTFLASSNCVLYCGGKVVFADIDSQTANIVSSEVEKNITKKTKAIIPVHFAGQPCEVDQIRDIGKKYNLIIIEDAAHALGAKYKGSHIGSCKYSDMTTLSFHPLKHITTGEGGAILTNRKDFYENLLMLRSHGATKDNFVNKSEGDWYYEMQMLGFNYRITDIQCALGVSQMKKLGKFVQRRRRIVELYNKAFLDNPYFDIPIEKDHSFSSYHLYPIRVKTNYVHSRKDIFADLRKNGLGVQVHYFPVYLQPYYRELGYRKGLCPIAEQYYSKTISLPLYPKMLNSDVIKVIQVCMKVFDKYRN